MADWDCSGSTVIPFPRFDPVEDAKVLRKAMKGLGTDEDRIIEILPNRTNSQRQEISEAFTAEFNRDLVKDLTSELSGNFRKLILALMEPPMVYLAKELNQAMKASGPDYARMRSDQRGVESQLSDDYRKMLTPFLLTCVSSSRDEDEINLEKVNGEKLKSGGIRMRRDLSINLSISHWLNCGSFGGSTMYGTALQKNILSLEEIIEKRFSGELKTGLLTFVKVAKGKQFYFADQIELALKGLGRDHSPLIRILVSKAELNLEVINQMYFKTQGMELEEALSGETSGDYRKTIRSLIQSP